MTEYKKVLILTERKFKSTYGSIKHGWRGATNNIHVDNIDHIYDWMLKLFNSRYKSELLKLDTGLRMPMLAGYKHTNNIVYIFSGISYQSRKSKGGYYERCFHLDTTLTSQIFLLLPTVTKSIVAVFKVTKNGIEDIVDDDLVVLRPVIKYYHITLDTDTINGRDFAPQLRPRHPKKHSI